MTDQHPLTDQVIHEEFLSKYCYTEHDLRAAADWQLEQVIEWLKSNTACYVALEGFLDDLKQAIRPTTTQQEDN